MSSWVCVIPNLSLCGGSSWTGSTGSGTCRATLVVPVIDLTTDHEGPAWRSSLWYKARQGVAGGKVFSQAEKMLMSHGF